MNEDQMRELLAQAQQAAPDGSMADQLWKVMHERFQQGFSHLPVSAHHPGQEFTVTELDTELHTEWMRHRY